MIERKTGEKPGAGVHQNAILDQATTFIQSLARERTVLLVFEDIHWADAGTIAMLCHLCQHLEGHAIMLVASYRPGDLTAPEGHDRHPLESARLELKRKYGDFEIRVDEASGREFVDALIDATPTRLDAGFRDALYRQTQGHPLFTVELLRDLRERKVIIKDGDGAEVLSQPVNWQALPIKAEAVIAERIGRLPQQLQRVLKVASVQGEDLTAEVVARIENIDEREIIRLLSEEADKRHQLVRALDVRRAGAQRLSVYRFRHILFQKYLYQSLDRVERSYLHESVGNTLETLLGNKADGTAVQLAHHFREASVPEKAFHYLALSGDKARRAYATKEATQIYSQALAVAEEIDFEVDQARLTGVYEGRGHVSMSLTRFDDAIVDFGAMRGAAREAGDLQNEAEALSQIAYCYFLKMGDDHIPAMEQCAKEALTLAEKTGDQNILSRSLTTLGIVHETRGELAAAIQKLEASRAICLKEDYKGALVQNLFHLGQQAYWQGNFEGAVPIAKEGVAVAEELRDGFHELFNRAVLCLSTWGCEKYGEAFEVLEGSLKKARETENRFLEGRLVNTQGWFHRDLGDFSGAVEFHEQGLSLAKSASVFNVEISALVDLGHDYLALGRLDRAMNYLEPTLERVENEGIGSHRWRWTVRLLNMIAEVHFAAGRLEEAARFNTLGLEKARATSSTKYEVSALALRAKLRSVHGEKETPEKDFGQAMALRGSSKARRSSCQSPMTSERGANPLATKLWPQRSTLKQRARSKRSRCQSETTGFAPCSKPRRSSRRCATTEHSAHSIKKLGVGRHRTVDDAGRERRRRPQRPMHVDGLWMDSRFWRRGPRRVARWRPVRAHAVGSPAWGLPDGDDGRVRWRLCCRRCRHRHRGDRSERLERVGLRGHPGAVSPSRVRGQGVAAQPISPAPPRLHPVRHG